MLLDFLKGGREGEGRRMQNLVASILSTCKDTRSVGIRASGVGLVSLLHTYVYVLEHVWHAA